MTPDEIRTSYAELADALTTSGLGWIVEQVEQTVRAGRAVEKPTRIFKEEEREEEPAQFLGEQHGARRAGKPTAMMTLEPWPDSDQLLFLIDGVRQAIIHAADIENEQLRLLRTVAGVESVSFEPDGEPADREPLRLAGNHDERIQTLGRLLGELEREAMQQPTTVQGFAERIARVIHEDYLGSLPIGQRGTSRSAVAWEDLPEEAKEQCTSDALRIPDVLAAVGLALQEGHPTPDQGANAARVIEENLETLAEAEHERWLEQKRREGWRYGPVVNREARTHNFLVPYESLPEAEKDKSRNAILRYTGIAQRAGYRIVPAGPGEGARW